MFCPQCGTQNELKQGYCRQCGQSLATVRIALAGRGDEVIRDAQRAERALARGLGTSGTFILVGVLIALISGGGLVPIVTYAGLGIIAGLPLILNGMRHLRHASRLLDAAAAPGDSLLEQSRRQIVDLPTAQVTDPLGSPPAGAASVTENTTLELKESGLK